MGERRRISLWEGTAEEPATEGGGALPERVDLAVVGGGYTGLSTALHAAEAGIDAVVLEARQIGHGGSGRNVGLVNAGIWLPPGDVRRALGAEYGPRFLRRFADGPAFVFDLIERHQIRCEAVRAGTVQAAHSAAGLRDLEARWRVWRDMGEPVDLLDRDAVAGLAGTEAFHGGLLDHRAGTVNPMGYARGLARAASGKGAGIFTGVRVNGLRKDRDGWVVETGRGTVRARAVVLGTNAYTDGLWPGLARSFTTIRYFQVATEPLGERAAGILPGRQGLWTTGRIMVSLRRDASGRLILGSMGRVFGSAESGLTRRWADRQVRRLFPALGPVRFEEAWDGRIAMTPDHLPRIHALDEGPYAPIGYNGRGITTGTIFGQAIAGLLAGANPATLPLPVTDLRRVRGAPLVNRAFALAFWAAQAARGV